MTASRPARFARETLASRLGAALLALGVAAPVLATVWTRATVRTRVAKGGSVAIDDVSYAGRDWNAALTALEVRQTGSAGVGNVATTWTFRYTNTDREPHYVALAVACLDSGGRERFRFKANATLLADRPGGGTIDVGVKMREGDWSATAVAKVVVDFLSSPEG